MTADATQTDAPPGLTELLEHYGFTLKGEIHTSEVCEIVSYDASKQKATVKPVVNGELIDGRDFEFPAIPNLPVSFPAGGGYSVTWPLSKGDTVVIQILTRPVNRWLENGTTGEPPQRYARFELGDSIVFAGIQPYNDPLSNASDKNMVIGQEDSDASGRATQITIHSDGNVEIGVPDGQKVIMGDTTTAEKALALASKVETELGDIWSALNSHTHPGVSTGNSSTLQSSTTGSANEVKAKWSFEGS